METDLASEELMETSSGFQSLESIINHVGLEVGVIVLEVGGKERHGN